MPKSSPPFARQIAEFALRASVRHMSDAARHRLKGCVLDALGCAFAALGQGPMAVVRRDTDESGGTKLCTLIGGGKTSPARATFYNGALVRYVDFNDSFLGEHGTCHPSDNLASVLAAAEYAGATGADLLAALAAAYEVQCRLTDRLPVMRKGFDHTTLLAYGAAAGVARALGLDKDRATHAVAISGDSALALTVTRAHPTSNWKGLAAPQATMTAVHTTFLAMRGITGPPEVFEGPKGFFEATGTKADIDWSDSTFNIATRTTLKPHNAEVHTQSTITAVLALRQELGLRAADVDRVKVEVFKVAYDITGGGAWGPRDDVHVKEEADHSLPYLVAVALLDGQVLPEQFAPKRINSPDVQELLKRVTVTDRWLFTRRYPKKVPSRVTVTLNDGRSVAIEADEFEGFHTAPMAWDRVVEKFEGLSAAATTAALRRRVIDAVADLEHVPAGELARLLGQARPGAGKARPRGRAGQRRAGSVRDGKTALPARR